MSKLFFSRKAVSDLSEIWEYTLSVWSENQADKYYKMLIDACEYISDFPESGKSYFDVKQKLKGYKIGRHILFYTELKANEIEIIRILHEKMDLKKQMRE